jgi:hypothetical protein
MKSETNRKRSGCIVVSLCPLGCSLEVAALVEGADLWAVSNVGATFLGGPPTQPAGECATDDYFTFVKTM